MNTEREKKLWLQFLLENVEKIAKEHFDGHYTIFSFTSNYKGCFGTPSEHPLEFTPWLKPFSTMKDLLLEMIKNPNDFNAQNCPDRFGMKEIQKNMDLYDQFEQEKINES